jgi:hypothetical protein
MHALHGCQQVAVAIDKVHGSRLRLQRAYDSCIADLVWAQYPEKGS